MHLRTFIWRRERSGVCPLVLISYSSKFHPAWHEGLTISECACVDTKQVLTVMTKDTLEQEDCDTETQSGVPGGDWGCRSESCRAISCGDICNKPWLKKRGPEMAQEGSLQVVCKSEFHMAEPRMESGLPHADYDRCEPLRNICKAHPEAVSIWGAVEWSSYISASLKISLRGIFQVLVEKMKNDGCIEAFIKKV